MCLCVIDSAKLDPRASGTGWKVFWRGSKRLYPEIRDDGTPYEIGEWYEACDLDGTSLGYLPGFHMFTTKADALLWCDGPHGVVRRVRWRHRLAMGTQQDWRGEKLRVVVAKEIMIPRLPRKRKVPA